MRSAARRRLGLAGGLSLALLAAAVIGVALGRSAIDEVNPVHYRDSPSLRAVQPDTAPPPQDSFAAAYDWNQGTAARAEDCGGDCDRLQAREGHGSGLDEPPPRRSSHDSPLADPPPWPPGAVDDGNGPAEQYAHFPIETKPAGASPAAALAIPRDDATVGR